jgi:hypothetical protein
MIVNSISGIRQGVSAETLKLWSDLIKGAVMPLDLGPTIRGFYPEVPFSLSQRMAEERTLLHSVVSRILQLDEE